MTILLFGILSMKLIRHYVDTVLHNLCMKKKIFIPKCWRKRSYLIWG